MLGRSSVIARNFSQSMVRFSGHGGVPGENLPFSIQNKYRVTALFTIGSSTNNNNNYTKCKIALFVVMNCVTD
ncbi:hypothetical protein ACLKA7_013234 [Drosophila subpalustris]